MSSTNSLPHALSINNSNVYTGAVGIDVGTYALIVGGKCVDVAYGTYSQALEQLDEWTQENGVDTETPFDELLQDDDYWNNGHIERLEQKPQRRVTYRQTGADFTTVMYSDGTVEYFDNDEWSVTSSEAV